MPPTPLMREDHASQVPALQVLQNLGWEYLSPAKVLVPQAQRKENAGVSGRRWAGDQVPGGVALFLRLNDSAGSRKNKKK